MTANKLTDNLWTCFDQWKIIWTAEPIRSCLLEEKFTLFDMFRAKCLVMRSLSTYLPFFPQTLIVWHQVQKFIWLNYFDWLLELWCASPYCNLTVICSAMNDLFSLPCFATSWNYCRDTDPNEWAIAYITKFPLPYLSVLFHLYHSYCCLTI